MATKQGLNAQVFMIRRKDLDHKKEKENTNKYNFQGQSARSILWFDLDHEWLEETFSTSEPDFYENFIKQTLKVKRQKNIYYM